MILERQLEQKLIDELSATISDAKVQMVGSRDVAANPTDTLTDKDNKVSVVAVQTGFRSHDAFSLSPISVGVTLAIATRIDCDPSAQHHEELVEKIAERLSHWHRFSNEFTQDFSTLEKMFCGELRMTGGSGRICDDKNRTWAETISFTIRGSEKFINQA